eukprot:4476653-Prymnesium_polylepis.1
MRASRSAGKVRFASPQSTRRRRFGRRVIAVPAAHPCPDVLPAHVLVLHPSLARSRARRTRSCGPVADRCRRWTCLEARRRFRRCGCG